MSYDITFKVKVEGIDKWMKCGDCDANITWNLRSMIEKSTGLPWINEADNGLCSEVVKSIEKGHSELINNRKEYMQYESPNGWGTVDGCIRFFRRIIDAWECLMMEDEDLAKVAHFWIE